MKNEDYNNCSRLDTAAPPSGGFEQ